MLTAEDLNELVVELASRPGHEKVRVLLHRLLVGGLGANSQDIDFERPVPEVRGRIDALLGRTVFELKSDLRRERKDAEKGLTRYLSEREGQTGRGHGAHPRLHLLAPEADLPETAGLPAGGSGAISAVNRRIPIATPLLTSSLGGPDACPLLFFKKLPHFFKSYQSW